MNAVLGPRVFPYSSADVMLSNDASRMTQIRTEKAKENIDFF